MDGFDVVTGSFGYTGGYITRRLLDEGRRVRTLTRRPGGDHPLATRIEAVPLQFGDRDALIDALRGANTFYNTYWRRFPDPNVGFQDIVEQSRTLIDAARTAGVQRLVQFSVANASRDAPTSYFVAKAEVEEIVRNSGLSFAIIRPTLLHGPGDILINNLAWALRRLPVFAMPGDGSYSVQPVFAGDVAELAIRRASQPGDVTVDASGPEVYPFADLVRLIRRQIGSRSLVIGLPWSLFLAGTRVVGRALRDVVLTRDELVELTSELLVSPDAPTCSTAFSEWLAAERQTVGRRYASELARNVRSASWAAARP